MPDAHAPALVLPAFLPQSVDASRGSAGLQALEPELLRDASGARAIGLGLRLAMARRG